MASIRVCHKEIHTHTIISWMSYRKLMSPFFKRKVKVFWLLGSQQCRKCITSSVPQSACVWHLSSHHRLSFSFSLHSLPCTAPQCLSLMSLQDNNNHWDTWIIFQTPFGWSWSQHVQCICFSHLTMHLTGSNAWNLNYSQWLVNAQCSTPILFTNKLQHSW